jgi:hypothetical protein
VRNSKQENDTSHGKRSQLLYRWTFNLNRWIGFSVDVDFSDLLVIIHGEDVGFDFSVDEYFQICLSSSMVRAGCRFSVDADFSDLLIIIGQAAGLDFLWMQILRFLIIHR